MCIFNPKYDLIFDTTILTTIDLLRRVFRIPVDFTEINVVMVSCISVASPLPKEILQFYIEKQIACHFE